MASIIKLKRSSTAGQVPGSLEEGELAINVKDERLTLNSFCLYIVRWCKRITTNDWRFW